MSLIVLNQTFCPLRFVFDFSGVNITQKKLNDIVKFPVVLDMNRYVGQKKSATATTSGSGCDENRKARSSSADSCGSTDSCGLNDGGDDFESFLREQVRTFVAYVDMYIFEVLNLSAVRTNQSISLFTSRTDLPITSTCPFYTYIYIHG